MKGKISAMSITPVGEDDVTEIADYLISFTPSHGVQKGKL